MKKTTIFFLGILLWFLFVGQIDYLESLKNIQTQSTKPTRPDIQKNSAPSRIRVVLMDTGYQSYYHSSVTVETAGGQRTYDPASPALSGGSLTLSCPGGFTLESVERACGKPHYKGDLTIYREPEGLLLVNTVPFEEYLKAVLPSEMPADYEEEALKAQAVCARTYAAKQIQEKRMESYHADVDDSVSCQVYGNIGQEDTTDRAVEETEGMVLEQDDHLIEAFYFSTSAGQTSTNEIWGNEQALPYLKSVPCSFDADTPWGNWETEVSTDEISRHLQSWLTPKDITWNREGELPTLEEWENLQVEDLTITRRSQSHAVTELSVFLSCALPLSGEQPAENQAGKKHYGKTVITGEYDVRKLLASSEHAIRLSDGTTSGGTSLLPSAYLELDFSDGQNVQICGKGYGHGVGMSQVGANEMAKQGYSCDRILDYFFQDVTICNLRS